MHALWNTFLYEPIHNALVFLIGVMPWGDVGLAIIVLTIIIKLILFPLSQKSIKSQIAMKEIQPAVDEIKEKYKGNKEEIAKQTFALYKEKKTNPFSGCLVVIIQLPVIFALYYVFSGGLDISSAQTYSFVHIPAVISKNFLGILDLTGKSLLLALLTGASQFFQMQLTMKATTPSTQDTNTTKSFAGDFQKSMNFQMKYILPIFITFISYTISAGVALYWLTSNLFAIGQELYVRGKIKKETAVATI